MNSVINQIIAIEDMAQEIVRAAKEESEGLEEEIKSSIADKKNEIETKVEQKNENIAEFEKNNADARIAEIKKKLSDDKQKLEKIYAENKSVWEDKIFNNIINN